MATVRLNTPSDATWARAWSVDNAAGRTALLANYLDPLGPKRGDIIYQVDTTTYYLVVTTNIVQQISGLAAIPINLATQVTGDLPYANLAQGSALSVLGVTGNATADNASIVAASDGQVVRRSGTSVAFGALDLSNANAITNDIPDANLSANVPLLNVSNTFTADQVLSLANPDLILDASGQAANQRKSSINAGSGDFNILFLNDDLSLQSAPMTIQRSTGNIQLTKLEVITSFGVPCGFVRFPGTQIPSAGANDLDDYEEGTWTPTITGSGGGSGQAYGAQVGQYIKIGKLVYIAFELSLSNKGTITTNLLIANLPFTITSTASRAPITIQYGNLATNWTTMVGLAVESGTSLHIRGCPATGGGYSDISLVTADVNNTSYFRGTGSYIASA